MIVKVAPLFEDDHKADKVFLPANISKEQAVFFDIETTGFAAEVTTMYLLGCVRFVDEKWMMYQWFADDAHSEEQILNTFFNSLPPDVVLIHYNGNGFDIPYISKRCEKYKMRCLLSGMQSIDLYKLIKPYKNLLGLENIKQKSVEKFFRIFREDKYSGGELIKDYGNYLKARKAHDPQELILYHRLILHNADDLRGLVSLTEIIPLTDSLSHPIVSERPTFNSRKTELVFNIALSVSVPGGTLRSYPDYSVAIADDVIKIKVKLYKDELKFFYPNYKDYYYIPGEDTAIHKSVSFYVDKEYRTQAKAANCYSKHTGCFVPQYSEVISPFFKIDYGDKISYLETTDEFLDNKELVSLYASHILNNALTK